MLCKMAKEKRHRRRESPERELNVKVKQEKLSPVRPQTSRRSRSRSSGNSSPQRRRSSRYLPINVAIFATSLQNNRNKTSTNEHNMRPLLNQLKRKQLLCNGWSTTVLWGFIMKTYEKYLTVNTSLGYFSDIIQRVCSTLGAIRYSINYIMIISHLIGIKNSILNSFMSY